MPCQIDGCLGNSRGLWRSPSRNQNCVFGLFEMRDPLAAILWANSVMATVFCSMSSLILRPGHERKSSLFAGREVRGVGLILAALLHLQQRESQLLTAKGISSAKQSAAFCPALVGCQERNLAGRCQVAYAFGRTVIAGGLLVKGT